MSNIPVIFIATSPFGRPARKPLALLEETGWKLIHNPYNRRLKTGEIAGLIREVDAVIAGTEPYTREILQHAKRLKVISRVGIGLDSVDLNACKELGISVTYTPDAPSQAVAELTVCNMINLCRQVLPSDRSVRETTWNRHMGVLLEEMVIGIVGMGRIGKRVCKLLQPFNAKIRGCDLQPDIQFGKQYGLEWMAKNELFQCSDLVTLHIPYHARNHHFVNRETIARMKTGSYLINTSRGGIVDEVALTDALLQKHLGGAALDVFEAEPYEGILAQLDNVVLTAHIGASARASRFLMEMGAAEDCIRVLKGERAKHDALKDSCADDFQNEQAHQKN